MAGRELPASGVDTYTPVVNADVPPDLDPALRPCQTGQSGTGFANGATATSGQDTFTDDACGPIPAPPPPTVTKELSGPPGQNPDGTWTFAYTVSATNPSTGLAADYSLTDTLNFGARIVIDTASVTGPGTVNPAWDGLADTDVFTGTRNLAAGAYQVEITATVPTTATQQQRDCDTQSGEEGTGFLNTATLTSGGTTSTDQACGEPVSPTPGPSLRPSSSRCRPDRACPDRP